MYIARSDRKHVLVARKRVERHGLPNRRKGQLSGRPRNRDLRPAVLPVALASELGAGAGRTTRGQGKFEPDQTSASLAATARTQQSRALAPRNDARCGFLIWDGR